MIFGTRDRWKAQTDRVDVSGTFYLDFSTFINFIRFKRVNYDYAIDYKSLVCVKERFQCSTVEFRHKRFRHRTILTC